MRAPYIFKRRRLVAVGIATATMVLSTAYPVTANPEHLTKPTNTTTVVGAVAEDELARSPRLESQVMLKTAEGDLVKYGNNFQEIEAGEYCLFISFGTFSDLDTSSIKMNFDGENLHCTLSVRDEDGKIYTKNESVGLQPQESLGLEISDVVELVRLYEEPVEISAETLISENGFDTTPYLSDYFDIVILAVPFWVGVV